MTVEELLAANHIKLLSTKSGRYEVICPQCSAKRKTVNQKKPVLGVTINGDTVHWGCNHCNWKGPEKGATNGAGDTRSLNGAHHNEHSKAASKPAISTQPKHGPKPKVDYIIDWNHPEAEFIYT